ncbi:MAG TPA: tetratricopeptide repeat protein [Ferruginibacter sp.]|nr:tetratricopeptide repeat protein [Ferruginibacter sp.]
MKLISYFIFFLVIAICAASCDEPSSTHKNIVVNDSAAVERLIKDSIQQFPDSLLLRQHLINYYYKTGEIDLALGVAEEALKRDSLNPRIWVIKGTIQVDNGDATNAIISFENAVKLSPDPEFINDLGLLYAKTKDPRAMTMANLLMSEETGKTIEEAFFIRGMYYNFSGDKQKAINNMDSCLAMNYTNTDAYREKAVALYDLGKYDAAMQVLTKGITLDNSFDEGYYWRGKCLEKLKRPDEAIEDYKTALMYDPDFVEAQTALDSLQRGH